MNIIIYLSVLITFLFTLINIDISPILRLFVIFIPICLLTYLCIKKFYLFANFITLWFGLQRYIGLIISLFPIFTITSFRIFFIIKEIIFLYVFIVLFLLFTTKKIKLKIHVCDIMLILYCCMLLFNCLFFDGNIWLKVLSLRRFIMLPLIYFIGRMAILSFKNVKNVLKFTVLFTVIICFYGLFEYFGSRDFIYTKLFNIDLFFEKQVLAGFIPIRFITGGILNTGIFIDYTFGILKPRLLTTFLEPTTLGAYLAFVFCITIFNRAYFKILNFKNVRFNILPLIFSFLFLLCIILTFSKGALIILLCSSSFILYFQKKIPFFIRKIYFYGVYVILFSSILFYILNPSGVSAHINGLRTGIITGLCNPFGLGLGNAGNYMEGSSTESIGAESAVGNTIAQIGIIGYMPYLLFLFFTIQKVIKDYKNIEVTDSLFAKYLLTTLGLFIGYSINSLFTESALGVTGNLYYFLFLGINITLIEKIKKGTRI